MVRFTEKRFDLYWVGEIGEDATENYGNTVASSKTLDGIRRYARMKKITDSDHQILEIGPDYDTPLPFPIEDTVAIHSIN